jgi:hypothetical protein
MADRRPPPVVFDTVCTHAGWPLDDGGAVVPLPGGRHQRVAAHVVVETGTEYLRLASRIGDAAVLNEPRLLAALRMNARLRLGAIAIDGQDLVMVHTLLVRDADADEVRATIQFLAQKADEFEKALFGRDES